MRVIMLMEHTHKTTTNVTITTAAAKEQTMPRINIILDDDTFEELKDLAKSKKKNMSETLRDALALEKWFNDTRAKGGRILVEQGSTGTAREIVPIR
jgi:predicted metal-dependent RNase